jgi:hypothetical protein
MFTIGKEDFSAQEMKRLYHPSSKLLMPEHRPNEMDIAKKNVLFSREHEVAKYRVTRDETIKASFTGFYSGGPV